MVNAPLSVCLCAGALGKDSQALVANFGKAAGYRDTLRLAALVAVDRNLAVLERRHIRRVAGHDAGFPFGPRDDHHVDIVRHHQPVGSDELEMQIGHQWVLSNFASNAWVAASNLS